mmetsp:Transcript_3961/g.15259  ORF Transcript_3961/g.15259 Transcript_3961/m.15259 type:complete len:316 (-) Transcript_3961:1430-2377(-)
MVGRGVGERVGFGPKYSFEGSATSNDSPPGDAAFGASSGAACCAGGSLGAWASAACPAPVAWSGVLPAGGTFGAPSSGGRVVLPCWAARSLAPAAGGSGTDTVCAGVSLAFVLVTVIPLCSLLIVTPSEACCSGGGGWAPWALLPGGVCGLCEAGAAFPGSPGAFGGTCGVPEALLSGACAPGWVAPRGGLAWAFGPSSSFRSVSIPGLSIPGADPLSPPVLPISPSFPAACCPPATSAFVPRPIASAVPVLPTFPKSSLSLLSISSFSDFVVPLLLEPWAASCVAVFPSEPAFASSAAASCPWEALEPARSAGA